MSGVAFLVEGSVVGLHTDPRFWVAAYVISRNLLTGNTIKTRIHIMGSTFIESFEERALH